jgi:polar amino acid transport system ATP-binding protein
MADPGASDATGEGAGASDATGKGPGASDATGKSPGASEATGEGAVSLSAKDIHLSFGPNAVLRGVDLQVPAGSTAVVIGPSGSGKSTLLRTLNRLYEPDRGDILLDGRSVLADNPDALRQRIGMVFQQFNLFPHRTVLDNVTLAPRKLKGMSTDAARELGLAQLERVGLRHKADVRPATLSGGQQQRVAIARALAMSPQVMFFDEATSALDPELVKGILELIAELGSSGMTMVVVTHEMGFARSTADAVVFMDHGKVVESGPPEQIFDAAETDRLRRFLSQVL